MHEPVSPQGCIMFAVSHGPLGGCDAQGQVNAVVDCRTMLAPPRPTARPAMSYA